MEPISPQAAPQWPAQAAEAATTAAAIDLGSNSFHLVIARRAGDTLAVDEHVREVVRLADFDAAGDISPAAMERGLRCLERFAQRLRNARPADVRVVGTNALRIAGNAAEFLAAAEERLGCRVETISGIEEARLIYRGVARTLKRDERHLVVDIGGGSTELIVGQGLAPGWLESLPVGCVGLTRQFFPDGRLGEQALRRAEVAARRELEPVAGNYRESGWTDVLGASGTVYTIARIARASGWSADGAITTLALDRLAIALTSVERLEDCRLPGLPDDQRPVLPGGLAIVRALFAGLGIRRLSPVDAAMRDGMLHETFARLRDEDVRVEGVRRLADACHVDAEHAGRVEQTAAVLLRQVASAWGLAAPEHAQWLAWAARLHECGRTLAHSGYHRHGAYIAEHADLDGCSREDQRNIALLIRTHRRVLPLELFDAHRQPARDKLLALTLLLRLAVLLHRARAGIDDDALQATVAAHSLTLAFPAGWLAVHPLVAADLEEETAYWRRAGWTLAFS